MCEENIKKGAVGTEQITKRFDQIESEDLIKLPRGFYAFFEIFSANWANQGRAIHSVMWNI